MSASGRNPSSLMITTWRIAPRRIVALAGGAGGAGAVAGGAAGVAGATTTCVAGAG